MQNSSVRSAISLIGLSATIGLIAGIATAEPMDQMRDHLTPPGFLPAPMSPTSFISVVDFGALRAAGMIYIGKDARTAAAMLTHQKETRKIARDGDTIVIGTPGELDIASRGIADPGGNWAWCDCFYVWQPDVGGVFQTDPCSDHGRAGSCKDGMAGTRDPGHVGWRAASADQGAGTGHA